MASVIKIKRSTTPGSAPSTLSAGEIAVNIPDRLLFVGDGSSIYRIGAQYLSVANASAFYATKAYAAANSYVKSTLANTNSYIATKVNTTTFNSALANTNTYIATKVNTTTFNSALANTNSSIATQAGRINSTNTALRTLISDRLQVANAAATYATKVNPTTSGVLAHTGRATISTNLDVSGNSYVLRHFTVSGNTNVGKLVAGNVATYRLSTMGPFTVEGRASVGTNLVVSGNTSVVGLKANNSLGSAGQFLRTNGTAAYWDALPSQTQYLQVANAVATFAVKSSPSTSGFFNHTGRLTVGTNLAVSGNTRISGSTIIDGDLTVEGAVTYISSSTLNVDDSMIKLAANNSTDAVDVGFYGKYASSGTKYSGLFRDATDGIFKFYTGSQTEPGTTVDTGAAGYAVATVEAVIDGGTY